MARPFAYNTGGAIAGTTQVGDLAIGYPTAGFEATGLQWWQGPNESTGYVVAKPISAGNQPTPVTEDALYMDPSLKGADIVLSNNNQTATLPSGSYQIQSVMGTNAAITPPNPTMFSVKYNSSGNTALQSRFIGVGSSGMNYLGPDGYPGRDVKGLGFNAAGACFFNGSQIMSGLISWNDGDLIDIALSNGEIWIRINGGNWNNNIPPGSNPTSGQGISLSGLDNVVGVLCPANSECTMTVLNAPPFDLPGGFNFLGNITASVAFNRSSTLTESSFIELAETLSGQTFATGDAANIYLNGTLGYWTSWVG